MKIQRTLRSAICDALVIGAILCLLFAVIRVLTYVYGIGMFKVVTGIIPID